MIALQPFYHRDHLCVAIRGDSSWQAVRQFPDRQFSITHRCWYILYNEHRLVALKSRLEKLEKVKVEGNFDQELPLEILFALH